MKIAKLYLLLLFPIIGHAQIGIGTAQSDPSSIIELVSTSKGLLPPRMTIGQRNLIQNPANGLVIFNTTTNTLEQNSGTAASANWNTISAVSAVNSGFESTNAVGIAMTDSKLDILVPGMVLTPPEGSYMVTFESSVTNTQVDSTATIESGGISTAQAAADLQNIYDQLSAKVATNSIHGAILGNGETLTPGVYSMVFAVTLLETLTLDGQNDPNAVFLFKIGAAFNVGAGAKVVLKNGVKACNVFWVVEAAIVLGASSYVKGMLLSNGAAVGAGANCVIEGRMFSTAAALTTAADFIAIPSDCSYVDLGILNSFVMFTSIGSITNTAVASITGNIGSNIGAITGFEAVALNGTIYKSTTPIVPFNTVTTVIKVQNRNKVMATFSLYRNGVLIPNSTKLITSTAYATNVSLHAIASVVAGESIELRWKTASDPIVAGNRILTAIKIP